MSARHEAKWVAILIGILALQIAILLFFGSRDYINYTQREFYLRQFPYRWPTFTPTQIAYYEMCPTNRYDPQAICFAEIAHNITTALGIK